jgi:cytochrome c oxidase subunit IV
MGIKPMADTKHLSPTEVAEEHQMEAHAPYLLVWFILAILTAVEYFYAFFLKDYFAILILGLLVLAFVKAGMVGWYFMHLKFEGNWVYLAIVPAFILATILVLALCPDQAMKPVDTDQEETVWSVPAEDSSPSRPTLRTDSSRLPTDRAVVGIA